ncbi:hypothetical protein FSP39_002782 [Pinctada imbricata]|uniref:Sphingomyelin phosphodiesterase 4 n=1 Tax=Pinctada imbricata TaxID=66713 RepID=A0AA88XMA2_PINIB|nr:hypothetical protein FSP39_002782 [Pinctada imbricata]
MGSLRERYGQAKMGLKSPPFDFERVERYIDWSRGFTTFFVRLQNVAFKSIPQRCMEMESVLQMGTKELRSALPQLLESIFGFGNEAGWGLDLVSRTTNIQDFECLRRLLSPEGPLLSLVYSLQADPYLSYEFPFSCLPAPTRHTIEDGGVPLFYANKLQYQGYGRPIIALTAFECYMFYFVHCLVNPQWQKRSIHWTNLTDCLYPCLLDDYLNYFLPLYKDSLPPMPHAASPVRSPVVHSLLGAKSGSPTPPRSSSRPGLLKSSFLAAHKQHTQVAPSLAQSEAETYRSETLVQVLVEFWLNQNNSSTDRQTTMSHSPMEHFLPSSNHVRLVRMLIKHLHSFANTATHIVVASPYQSHMVSSLDEFKKSIFPHIVQKKLYAFLRHGFDRWPLDCSFRIMLETWLSYIQPWRYLTSSYTTKSVRRDSDADSKTVEEKWFPFVEGNLLFYTVLYQEFIVRLFRMDLTTLFNACMLFRVAKVFSLPNLSNMIQRAEREMCLLRNGRSVMDLGGSYLSPETNLSLTNQIAELEKPGFQYILMYGEETLQVIKQVLAQIDISRRTITALENSFTKPHKSGLAALFDVSSWFDKEERSVFGDLTSSEVKKLKIYLDSATKNLCYIFDISSSEHSSDTMHTLHGLDQSSFLNVSAYSPNKTPDYIRTDDGIQLTPLGRRQMMNKMKHFDVCYQGDPDLQPIRSYENATAVRLLYHLCNYVNTQFGEQIQSLYDRDDLIGRFSHVFLAPSLSRGQKIDSPIPSSTRRAMEEPRLSLRFFGSYKTMMYLCFLYFVARVWLGMGPVGFTLCLMILIAGFGLFRAVFLPVKSHTS